MQINRRFFLHKGALAVAGTAAIPSFLVRSVMAQAAPSPKHRLVVVFQRGAADGLNIVVPYREKNYYAMRPSIAIPQNQVLDLDGSFGLHPSLAAFKPLYDQGHLAIVHAAGSPDTTRSHFDAQDYMESGTPGVKSTQDGWLNRALQAEDLRHRCAGTCEQHTAFRALALGNDVPRTLAGKIPAIALSNVNGFAVAGRGPAPSPTASAFEAMYADSGDRIFTDVSGWDTHQNQGSVNGQLANRLSEFSASIAAFWSDMGDDAQNITLVTMSEFGRTARENGTGGTDHGHANAMFVVGGNVKGGKVYGKWPGLDNDQLNEGRDLVLTTDFRQVLGEVVSQTLGASNMEEVFPGAGLNQNRFLRLT